MKFFTTLEGELREGIDKILTHPFLKRIENAQLDKEQLQYFAKQYDVYCKHFPRFLAACAANITDDKTRMPIVENLWEEHGEGKMEGSHRILYENFMDGMGISNLLKKRSLLYRLRQSVVRICSVYVNPEIFSKALAHLDQGPNFLPMRSIQSSLEDFRNMISFQKKM